MKLLLTTIFFRFSVVSATSSPSRIAADFLVEGLGDVEPAFDKFEGKMYAGMLPIDENSCAGAAQVNEQGELDGERDGELMFWLFEPEKAANPDAITIWLNGGPGCSSLNGGIFENAVVTSPHTPAGGPPKPWSIVEPLLYNEYSWTNASTMLYLEQPVGTGFTHGPAPDSEYELTRDFYNFMQHFYCTFPHMRAKKLFIFGESYAGMYVPSMAHRIHIENVERKKKDKHNKKNERINLAGIAIGNGWMDAKGQGRAAIDYGYWHGMIDSATKDALHAKWEDCVSGAHMEPPFHDFTIPDDCNIGGAVMKAAGADLFFEQKPNQYDVTTWNRYPSLNTETSSIWQLLNNPDTKKALHVPLDVPWDGCIPGAGRRRRLTEELPGKLLLKHDRPESVIPYVSELLDEANIRVLVYNADRDLSVCAQGSEMILDSMEWSGASHWKNTARGLWTVDGVPAGYSKKYKNLDFLIVLNSGHLVPHDVPNEGLDLIVRMVTDQEYSDYDLPTFVVDENDETPKKKKEAVIVTLQEEEEDVSSSSWGIQKKLYHAFFIILDFVAGMLFYAFFVRRKSNYQRLPNVSFDANV